MTSRNQQLLARGGLLLQKSRLGRAWIGPVALDFGEGTARITAPKDSAMRFKKFKQFL